MTEWEKIKIDKLCTIEKGQAGLAKATSGQYPLVTTGYKKKTCNEYQFNAKAVCIPLVSSTGHGKKTLNYVHYQEGKFALGTILAAVIPKDDEELDAKYLHLYLTFFKDRILVPLMRGAANVSLSIKDIKNIYIPVPSINIQKSIIAKYYKIKPGSDELLEIINHQSKCFKQLRQIILQEAVEGKLTADWRKKNPELISGENSAENLLKKIKIEKEQLIKEEKIKTQKPLLPISEAGRVFKLPESWIYVRVGEVIKKISLIGKKLKKREYLKKGKLPIIDQGQKFIGGYSNKKQLIVGCELPVIIFGDHTKIFKFVNFKFIAGADGIKVIKPIGIYQSKLFYYFLRALILPKKGYARHFQFLEKSYIPLPPLSEQKVIIERLDNIMDTINELEKQANQRKEQTAQLIYSVLREAFEQK